MTEFFGVILAVYLWGVVVGIIAQLLGVGLFRYSGFGSLKIETWKNLFVIYLIYLNAAGIGLIIAIAVMRAHGLLE